MGTGCVAERFVTDDEGQAIGRGQFFRLLEVLGPVGPPFSAGDADFMICLLHRWFVPAEQIVGAFRGEDQQIATFSFLQLRC